MVSFTLRSSIRLGYSFTPYQRLRLYNGAPFSRLLRHAGDTEDVFSAYTPGVPTGGGGGLVVVNKRDDFNFHITNFPFLSSNIPSSPIAFLFLNLYDTPGLAPRMNFLSG